jgi:N-acetylneuraminic acid mutarotase
MLETQTSTWHKLPPMKARRGMHPVMWRVGHVVYVAGGSDTHSGPSLSSLEMLDLTTMVWSEGPSMVVGRSFAAGTVLSDGQSLLVTAGKSAAKVYLSSVEVFNLQTNTWSTLESSIVPARGSHCCVLYKDQPVILGGESQTGTLSCCLKYDESGKWVSIADMPSPRHSFGATVVNKQIYVLGGIGTHHMSSQEIIRFDGVAWHHVESMAVGAAQCWVQAVCIKDMVVLVGGNAGDFVAFDPNKPERPFPTLAIPSMRVSPDRLRLAAISF